MRSVIIGMTAGLALGLAPIAALDGVFPRSPIPYSGEQLRLAIADGMSRAGAAVATAESPAP